MADVSRETAPRPDAAIVSRVFAPDRLPALERYAGWLASAGVVRGLIGPREVPRLWDRHLINCGLLASLVPENAAVADLGSGAGLPGLVLALSRPDLRVTLIEPMARRVDFLLEVCADLGTENVTVVRGRAEQHHGTMRFDVVTSRALAPLPRLLAWSIPLLAPTGVVLAIKGTSAQAEVAGAARDLSRRHLSAEVLVRSVPGASATTVVRVVSADEAAIGWRGGASARRRRREPT
jgi:16S rRNA (guanine527-N7)-methyltransferase